MPVTVEQINEYLFSDTVQSQKKKSGSDETSQGQNISSVECGFYHCFSVLVIVGSFNPIFLVMFLLI